MNRLFAFLVRWAGGRPHVVLPLAAALDQAAEGYAEVLRTRNPRRVLITPKALRLLVIVFSVLGSVLLALLFLLKMPPSHPHPLVVVIVAGQWLITVAAVSMQAGPTLLLEDDARLLGGWPLSRREIVLARLLTILKPALQLALALGGLPVLAAAFAMQPPVLQALSLALGLVVQAVGVGFGITVLILLTVRALGRRRSERVAALLGDGNAMALVFLLYYPLRSGWGWLQDHPDVVYILPPGWILAFADWQSGPVAWLWAGIGVVVQVLLVTYGLRLLAAREQGQQITTTASGPTARSLVDGPVRLLGTLLRGREGRVIARLFAAHLRDDWRFVGGFLGPLILLVVMSGIFGDLAGEMDLEALPLTALTSVPLIQMFIMLVVLSIMVTQTSSRPEAIWLVALGDLDGAHMLASVRRLILLVMGGPVLVIYAVTALRVGADWVVVVRDVAIMGAEIEIALLLVQPLLPWLPFSRPFAQQEVDQRLVAAIAASLISFAPVLLNLLYAEIDWFRWLL